MSFLITMGQRQQMRAADEDVKALIQQTHPQPMNARVGGRGAGAQTQLPSNQFVEAGFRTRSFRRDLCLIHDAFTRSYSMATF